MVGGRTTGIRLYAFNNDLATLHRAIMERVYYVKGPAGFTPPPRPLPGAFRRLEAFRELVLRQVPVVVKWTPRRFCDSYNGRLKTVYELAMASLAVVPVRKRDAQLKSFVKCEKTDHTAKADPVPRVVQPREPRYNLELGCYTKPLEPLLYKGIAKAWRNPEPTVIKGMNAEQAADCLFKKWKRFNDPVAVGLDASRFDQHVSVAALRYEHEFYRRKFNSDHLDHLLGMQLKNQGVARVVDGTIRYSFDGRRCSGDMNTGLGNCILMCAMIWEYCRQRQVVASLANNGDDCVVFMERSQLGQFTNGLTAWFLELGFTMVMEDPVFDFERVTFCQTRPVYDGTRWTLVRLLTALEKDLHHLTRFQSRSAFEAWVTSVGLCGLALTGGLPVYQSFYSSMLISEQIGNVRANQAHKTGGLFWWSKGMDRKVRPVSDAARVSFWRAFDITPTQQVYLEHFYEAHPPRWSEPQVYRSVAAAPILAQQCY